MELVLAYADDVAFFPLASFKYLKAIREILEEFSRFSGLQVNTVKSMTIVSKRALDKAQLAAVLGFTQNNLPVNYLGVPLTGRSISSRDCSALITDLQGIFDRWKGKRLSYSGRIQLIEWIFHGKYGYTM